MRYEGVTFIAASVLKMDRDEFVREHVKVLWTDRPVKVRRKMLAQVYGLIAKDRPEQE